MNVDLIFGGGGRDRRRLGATAWRRCSASTPRPHHVSAYALTVEPGTPLARRPGAPSRRRRPGPSLRAGRRRCSAPPATAGTRCRTGPCPATSAGTTALYWAQGDYRGIGCAAHSHRGRPPVVEHPHPRALHRRRRAPGDRPRPARRSSPPSRRPSRASPWRCGRRWGCRHRWCPTTPTSTALVERRGDRAVLTVRGRLLANEVTVRLACPGDRAHPVSCAAMTEELHRADR